LCLRSVGCLWVFAYRDKKVVGVAVFVRRFIAEYLKRCQVSGSCRTADVKLNISGL
jgi:hypothetical protein